MDKIEDFGVYVNVYYFLKVEIYKSKFDEKMFDLLWNKYWVVIFSFNFFVLVSFVLLLDISRIIVEEDVEIDVYY